MTSRLAIAIVLAATSAISLAPTAGANQVGAYPTTIGAVLGDHSYIHQPLAVENGTYARVYNVTATLPDGDFIQAGYLDPASSYTDICGGHGWAWFVTILFASGGWGGPKLYNTGGCGLSGSHWFRTRVTFDYYDHGQAIYAWTFELDGTPIGPALYSLYNTFDRSTADIFSEIVDTQPPPTGAGFPTAEYGTALGVKLTDGSWHDIAHGQFFHTSDAGCPPYHMQVLGTNDVETYRSLASTSCYHNGDQLW